MSNYLKRILTINFFIVMGLFNIFQIKATRFVSEKSFKDNLKKQTVMSNKTLTQLRKYKITESSEKKLEYFFYTNKIDKAIALSKALEQLSYSKVEYGQSASDKNLFLINGWTNNVRMSSQSISMWTQQMCELGYKYDCDFDGWGTNTN